MAVKTKHQARTQVGDSDLLEGSRALSTRPSLNMKRAQRKSRQNPVSLDEGHNLLLDLPPELRNIVYEYYVASEEPFYVVDSWVSKRSRVPSLLIVNRQIRKEVLPVFYKTNEFCFPRCDAKYITRWLFGAVQPQHLNLISAISWTSGRRIISSWPGRNGSTRYETDAVEIYSKAANESAIHLSSVIMLLELGLLGPCKVKLALCNEPRLHVACKLRELTMKTIARKELAADDTWNEHGLPGENDVAGLSYAVSKEWAKSVTRAFQNYSLAPPLAAEIYCSSCQTISTSPQLGVKGLIFHLPWVSRNEGVESTHDQSDKASSTEANQ